MPAPSPLNSLQADFAAALRMAAAPVPQAVTSHCAPHPKRRFDVYRNNVYASLIGLLEARYPVTLRIVGQEFFRAMARVYVDRAPPSSPVLLLWGASFPAFLSQFEPVQDLPYLPDVARLEWARQAAYHAADATPLSAETFAAIPPDATTDLVFNLHPSMQMLASAFAIVTIWEVNSAKAEVGPVDIQRPEAALVIRPHLDVQVLRIPEDSVVFIETLAAGQTLGAAYEAVSSAKPDFDLAANLAGLIRSGAIIGDRSGRMRKSEKRRGGA